MDHNRSWQSQVKHSGLRPGHRWSSTPRRHVNTAVVSVQDHFTPSELEILDVTESQAEDYLTEESPNPIHHNSEMSHGYEDFPQTFKLLLQQHIKLQLNTMPTQTKFQN